MSGGGSTAHAGGGGRGRGGVGALPSSDLLPKSCGTLTSLPLARSFDRPRYTARRVVFFSSTASWTSPAPSLTSAPGVRSASGAGAAVLGPPASSARCARSEPVRSVVSDDDPLL